MLEYDVTASRTGLAAAFATCARCPGATVALDADTAGRTDALNPAELLLAAVGACMLKGIERVAPMLRFRLEGAAVHLHGVRQDAPPRMLRIAYELVVDTDEPDRRLDLLHENLKKFGTIYNTVAAAVELTGQIRRGPVTDAIAAAVPGRATDAPDPAFSGADEYC